ncbi:MAG TPA: tRNA threonylcarbamoyladenosine dehydratase [Erysipelothrix sp.]|nr:tRNA threonylcarbamoyladenosine dehydratase [Erysipelothrix sp.]
MAVKFQRVQPLFKGKFEQLVQKKVAVVGLGGVGGICVEALARSGMSNLVIIDYDRYELSNINRQVGANTLTINQLKAEVMADKLLEINPSLQLEVHRIYLEEPYLEQYLGSCDAIVDAIDSMGAKMELIRYGLSTNKVFLSSMGMANRLDPTQLEVTNIEKTYNDPFAKKIRLYCKQQGLKNLKVVSSKELPTKNDKMLTSFMPVTASAGLLLASQIMKDLLEKL